MFPQNNLKRWRSKSFKFLHHIASSSGSPQDVNTSWYITIGSMLGNHISFSASTNKTKFTYWSFQDMWSETWPFLADQQFHTSNNTVFMFLYFQNLSHSPTVLCCICVNQNNVIYFEIPLFWNSFWSCLKSGQKLFSQSGLELVS